MTTLHEATRRWASLGISVLLLTLSVAIPALEQADLVAGPVAESEHSPGECPRGHDHTICTQVGANLSVLVDDQGSWMAHGDVAETAPHSAPAVHAATYVDGRRSRAPPQV